MRSARLGLVTAVAASSLLVGSPAQARHVCNLQDPGLNEICESHPEENPYYQRLIQKIFCLISPNC